MDKENNLVKIKKINKTLRKLEYSFCSIEIKDGFNNFLVIGKNENGFIFKLNFKEKNMREHYGKAQ